MFHTLLAFAELFARVINPEAAEARVIERVAADLERGTKRPQLVRAHHRAAFTVAPWHVELARKSVLREQLGDAQIERVPVVPRRRDVQAGHCRFLARIVTIT